MSDKNVIKIDEEEEEFTEIELPMPYVKKDRTTMDWIEDLRKNMVEALKESGGLGDADNAMAINTLLNSMESSIHKKVNNQLKMHIPEQTSDSVEQLADFIKEVLSKQSEAKDEVGERGVEIPTEYIPTDIVPDEDFIGLSKPTLKEIMNTPNPEDEEE